MTNFIVTEAENVGKDVISDAKALVADVQGVIVNDIVPDVKNFFNVVVPAEVAALKPYAIQAIEEVGVDLPTLLVGDVGAFWAALAPALAVTASKAEAAGVAAAKPVVLAAVGSVVADAESAVASVGTTDTAATS